MDIHSGFTTPQTGGKVCILKKSLYGLKQSPRAWFDRFRRTVCGMGYMQCMGITPSLITLRIPYHNSGCLCG